MCRKIKKQKLTNYKGNGYEIACGANVRRSDFVMTADVGRQNDNGLSWAETVRIKQTAAGNETL